VTAQVAAPTTPRRGHGKDAGLLVLALAVAAGTILAVLVWGGPGTSDPVAQAQQVAAGLRCPVCQDLSAADSPAPMAAEMRRQILRDLRSGHSPDQIRSTFVRAYGPSVLMTPPRRGLGSVAYLLPALVVLVAAGSGTALLRRLLRRPSDPSEEARP
jgi:cytochrome c-type biogenesis protein CcmH